MLSEFKRKVEGYPISIGILIEAGKPTEAKRKPNVVAAEVKIGLEP
jgi:hypothetical protein